MNRHDELFDSRLADWLEEEPTRAPAQLLEVVQAALPSVPQRRPPRLPWGRWAVPVRFGLAGAAILVALTVAIGAGLLWKPGGIGGQSTPTPSTSPPSTSSPLLDRTQIPTSGLVPFTSPLYGYVIEVPGEWTARVATERLGTLQTPWADSQAVDYITAPVRTVDGQGGPLGSLDIASTDVDLLTLDEWTASTALDVCGEPESTELIDVGGEPARFLTYPGCNGYFHIWTTVVHGSTGTHVVWLNLRGSESADRELFLRILGTFRFPTASPGPSAVASPGPT